MLALLVLDELILVDVSILGVCVAPAARAAVFDEIELEVIREGGRRALMLEVVKSTVDRAVGRRIDARLTGAELENFWNPDEPGMSAGVLTTEVEPGSRVYAYGLRAGDVIVGANRRTVSDIGELREATKLNPRQLVLRVYRNGRFGNITIR